MAGKFGAKSAWLLVDGYNLLSAKIKNLAYKVAQKNEDTTGLGDLWQEFTPTGLGSVTFTVTGGYFDTTATTGAHAALSAPQSSPQATAKVICCGFADQAAGEQFVGFAGAFQHSYDVQSTVGDLTKANAEYVVSGRFERGQIVQPLATKSADWSTDTLNTEIDYTLDPSQTVVPITSNTLANPSVVTTPVPHGLTTGDIIYISGVATSNPTINGERTVTVVSTTTFTVPVNVTTAGTGGTFVRSNTTGGAVGFQQVTDCSGFTNYVGKIRDSADNSTYADLITFTDNVTDPYAQRVTTTGTIDRYLTFDGNVTGTGSITVFAGLCRL